MIEAIGGVAVALGLGQSPTGISRPRPDFGEPVRLDIVPWVRKSPSDGQATEQAAILFVLASFDYRNRLLYC